MKKTLALLLALLTVIGLLAGCAKEPAVTPDPTPTPGPNTPDPKPTDPTPTPDPVKPAEPYVYYWVRSGEETTLNPHEASGSNDYPLVDRTAGMLYHYVPTDDGLGSKLVPVYADGVPVADASGLVWTIKLKKDAKWADGEPITADDWLYSWKMQLDPNQYWGTAGTSMVSNFITIKGASEYYNSVSKQTGGTWEGVGIKKVDDYTITVEATSTFTAEEVMRHFYLRYGGLVKEELYSKCISADGTSCDYGSSLDKLAFAGQFVITEWQKASIIVMEKNPNWPLADMTHIDKVVSRVVQDESTRLELFEKGEADHISLGTNGMAKYGEDPRVLSYDSKTINALQTNNTHKDPVKKAILSDPEFRQAIFFGIDRNSIAKLLDARATPYHLSTIGQILDDGTLYRNTPEAKALVEKWAPNNNGGYDPVKAKSMMEAVLKKNGQTKLTLTLIYTESSEALRQASEYIDAQFDKVYGGLIDLELKALPSSAKNDTLRSSWREGSVDTWDLGWAGWGLASEDFYPWKKFERYMTDYKSRFAPYSNTKLDAIYNECLKDENRLSDKNLLKLTVEGESAWYDDMTDIPVYATIYKYMYQERVNLPMTQYTSQNGFGWYFSTLK